MPPTTTATLAAEVFFRVAGKLTIAQIEPYLNRALNLLEFGGQYVWDLKQTSLTPANFTGFVAAPPDLDLGKDIFCNNATYVAGAAGNQPIMRITADKDWRPDDDAGSTFSTTEYSSFYVLPGGLAAPGQMRFFPPLAVAQPVIVLYHAIPTVLSGVVAVPWIDQWMDDLLCDLAEMEIKRIANWVGWPELEQRSLARLKEAIARFGSERMVASLVEQVQAPTPKGN